MKNIKQFTAGVAVSLASTFALPSHEVLAHEANVRIVNDCAGEGNEASIDLTGFQNHNLLNDVVYIDFIATSGTTAGNSVISDTVNEQNLITDGTETLTYDLPAGEYAGSIAWIVDYNNNGTQDNGESFYEKSHFTIDECVVHTTSTTTTTTPPITNTSIPPTVISTPDEPKEPTSSSNPPTILTTPPVVVESETPESPKLPATGTSEYTSRWVAIASLVTFAGISALIASRRTRNYLR